MTTNNNTELHSFKSSKKSSSNDTKVTRMHPSMKRPRAPIACYRCHHKKVRCDGVHPNCSRCLSTGFLCAYPSSRRSRNTQPTNIDPFIDNLSQLEARIRKIETDLESQRTLVNTFNDETLSSRIQKTEKELNESRSIVAQLRLRGEQRVARGKRAAQQTGKAKEKTYPIPTLDYTFYNNNDHDNTNFSNFQHWSFAPNAFVDPMILAAAEQGIAPPALSVSNYMVDEDTSMMAARAKSLPYSTAPDPTLLIPGLQPSSSSTSTTSTASFSFYPPFDLLS